jgi:hypothetical protein
MRKGYISINLSGGSSISYANKFLVKKTGNDGSEWLNEKFQGENEKYYMYSGLGDDTYDFQDQLGMIKADYEYLKNQLKTYDGNNFLVFPEADENHGDTETLIRHNNDFGIGYENDTKVNVRIKDVESIGLQESFAPFPFGREAAYRMDKNSPNFRGHREYAEEREKQKKNVEWIFDEINNHWYNKPIYENQNQGTF